MLNCIIFVLSIWRFVSIMGTSNQVNMKKNSNFMKESILSRPPPDYISNTQAIYYLHNRSISLVRCIYIRYEQERLEAFF